MGSIKLKNIRVFSYHGCLEEEGKIGSEYRVDLKVKGDLSNSAKTVIFLVNKCCRFPIKYKAEIRSNVPRTTKTPNLIFCDIDLSMTFIFKKGLNFWIG